MSPRPTPPRPTLAELAQRLEAQQITLEEFQAHIDTIRAFLVKLEIPHQQYDDLLASIRSTRGLKPSS